MDHPSLPLRLFLKIIKRAIGTVLYVDTLSHEHYELEYLRDQRIWKISYQMGQETQEPFVDYKKNPTKLVDRIEDVVQVCVKYRDEAVQVECTEQEQVQVKINVQACMVI